MSKGVSGQERRAFAPRPQGSSVLPKPGVAALSPDHTGKPPRVGMISLGCPKNLVDAEIMLGELEGQGHDVVIDVHEAEVVIVNTCGFIGEAREESIEAILEVAEQKTEAGGPKRLLVSGCMASRYAEELAAEIPEIDGFIGLDQLQDVSGLVRLGSSLPLAPHRAERVFDHTAPRLVTTRGFAYLKVAEGCNNPCTFCAIPVWRGRFRSRTIKSLVAEAKRLEAEGFSEIVLLAQDTTRYGEDLGLGRYGLVRLVEALLAETTIPWIRFMYAYPTTLDEELLALMGGEERFVSYLDMPLQHSHPEMLTSMRRGGSAARYLRLLERTRQLVPDVFLRTTFIVGFPGETLEHLRHLEEFICRARFDHLGAFAFSPEEDTPAATFEAAVDGEEAERRLQHLLEVQRPISLERRQRLVGKTLEMLLEGQSSESDLLLEARHQGMAPGIDGRVLIVDGCAAAPSLVEVEVTEAHADDLVGRIVGPRGRPDVVTASEMAAGHDPSPASRELTV